MKKVLTLFGISLALLVPSTASAETGDPTARIQAGVISAIQRKVSPNHKAMLRKAVRRQAKRSGGFSLNNCYEGCGGEVWLPSEYCQAYPYDWHIRRWYNHPWPGYWTEGYCWQGSYHMVNHGYM